MQKRTGRTGAIKRVKIRDAEKTLAEFPKVNGLTEVMQATGKYNCNQESTLKKCR